MGVQIKKIYDAQGLRNDPQRCYLATFGRQWLAIG
jgi:hypothetical protein